ncbi:hypothetical protein ACHAXT_009481 [Thalassiosira profunda]
MDAEGAAASSGGGDNPGGGGGLEVDTAGACAEVDTSSSAADLLGDAGLLLGFAQSPAAKAAAEPAADGPEPAGPQSSGAGVDMGNLQSADLGGEGGQKADVSGDGPGGEDLPIKDTGRSGEVAADEKDQEEKNGSEADVAEKPEAVPSKPPPVKSVKSDSGENKGEEDEQSFFSSADVAEEEPEAVRPKPPPVKSDSRENGGEEEEQSRFSEGENAEEAAAAENEKGQAKVADVDEVEPPKNSRSKPRKGRPKRKAREKEGVDGEEVEFVSSSPPRNLRRSARESTPTARLVDMPLISSKVDEDSTVEEVDDEDSEDEEEEEETFPFEVSDTVRKIEGNLHPLCRAVDCGKFSQGQKKLGLCTKHFNEVKAFRRSNAPQKSTGGGRASKKRRRGRQKKEAEEGEDAEVEFVSSSPGRPKRKSTPPVRLRDATNVDSADEEEEEEEEEEGAAASPRRSEEKRPRGRQRTKPRKAGGPQCKHPGCDKWPRGGGYCLRHTNEREEESLVEHTVELSGSRKRGSPKKYATKPQCKSPGCEKYSQTGREGFCAAHHTEERRRKRRKSRGPNDSSEGSEEESPRKRRKLDDDSPKKSPGKKRGSPKTPKTTCKSPGCEKWPQPGRDGFCVAHFREEKKRIDEENKRIHEEGKKNGGSAKKKKKGGRKAKGSDVEGLCQDYFPSRRNFPVGSPVVVRDRMLKRGEYLEGGVARVTKVQYAADGTAKYDVAYMLGGEESSIDGCHLADGCDLSVTNLEGEQDDKDDDDFSFSGLDKPTPPNKFDGQRELIVNAEDLAEGPSSVGTRWRCGQCGDLNPPNSRCSTCRNVGDNASELALLERTRYELLNGRDFWICTRCEIEIPSVASPCGGCNRTISFVPLEIEEFEVFVRKQRKLNAEKAQKWQHQQQQMQVAAATEDDWIDHEEEQRIAKQKKKRSFAMLDNYKSGPNGKFFCQFAGCLAARHPNCRGFCTEHIGKVSSKPAAFPVVKPGDEELVEEMRDPLYLIYEQMVSCTYEESDKQKGHERFVGFPGLCCKHCAGKVRSTNQAPSRWFPSSDSAMYSGTFTRSIKKHLFKCAHCPSDVKKQMRLADEARAAAKEKAKSEEEDKSKKKAKVLRARSDGSRKKFFHRMWRRLHRAS